MTLKSIFKNANKAGIGNAWTSVYTAPQTSYFIHLNIASVGDGGQVSVRVYDATADEYTYTVRYAPVPSGSSLIILSDSNKIVLEPGDRVEVKSESTGVSFDVQSSLLEDVNS